MNLQAHDMPAMAATTYGSCSSNLVVGTSDWSAEGFKQFGWTDNTIKFGQLLDRHSKTATETEFQPQNITSMPKRIVRVYLADTDDNVPLEKSLLYTGSEKLTDLTDQELYFEIPVTDILAKHNEFRKTVVNKKSTQQIGKEVFLDPVKIRDLKMTVVTVASF